MAKPKSKGAVAKKKGSPADPGWAKLTWDDLEGWAGVRSVERGRSYQRGGRVKDLMRTGDGGLLATVVGGDRYVTNVALSRGRKGTALGSSCTCPVGVSCKHAVAVVAEYLKALADKSDVPIADEDDPRWAILEEGGIFVDDDGDDDDAEEFSGVRPRTPRRPARRTASTVNWDAKIEAHLRAKSQGELADLVWSLTRRFPEIYQEFRERIALQEGDVERLLAEARVEIRKVTSEPAWRNHWNDEGHTPDYSRIRHRFERLLELGHADQVVSLGREFIEKGLRQVGESHDEGETATAFANCLQVVFQAVARSSLSGPERLLLAIDAELDDDYDAIGDAAATVLDAPTTPEDWSAVADALSARLKTESVGEGDGFSRHYRRDRVTGWIASALREAGRDEELGALYESEARVTGSYERLVNYLLEARRFDDAERWAREGIAATSATYPGIAVHLAETLAELAKKRKQWDVVAAHLARPFFEHPGPTTFDALIKAAKKAGVEDVVRASALRFLETGAAPYRVIAPRPEVATSPRARSSAKKTQAASNRPPAPSSGPKEVKPVRVKVDPDWPLPIPDELVPLLDRPGRYDPEPHPHLEVLLEMAIAAKDPDEVLRWFDKIRSRTMSTGYGYGGRAHADRVAEAVAAVYPERAIEIYLAALRDQLPHAQQSAYETAVGYLRKLRPIHESLGRAGEWSGLVASIRESYRNRPRFMELLDRLDGRTIVQTAKISRK